MNEESNSNGTVSPVMVEDLILTDTFLIKGRLPHKGKRLTNLLEDHTRTFLQVQDATMVALRSNDVITTPSVMVNVKEVIFAHELVEIAGDAGMRRLAMPNKSVRIRAFYNGPTQFELSGTVEPGAYESAPTIVRKYFIMQLPVLRGLELERDDLRMLNSLDYVIVRKDRMSYVYDFG